jgi:carboxyl-terminal processing protease
MKKRTAAILAASAAAICIFWAFTDSRNFEIAKNLEIYYSLFRELDNFYVDEVDPGLLIQSSIDKMLEGLDPYTNFIPESSMEDYRFMTTGQYGGVGAMIRQRGAYVMVTEVYENFPAHKASVVPGDLIYEIDGRSTKNMDTEEVSTLLKGQPGTQVSIKVKRGRSETLINKELTREKISLNSIAYSAVLPGETGYILLNSFTQNCAQEVKMAFSDLKKQGIKSLILDLRNNPGGLLNESVDIANIFIGRGNEVVSTRGKYPQFDAKYHTSAQPLDTVMPLVVLINGASASASEIVAGALQDFDRAIVIGQRSFGKGLVQTTRDLAYNSKLKVTTARYYIPSGRCIQALDYTHKNKDGSAGSTPDSLKKMFRTAGGRPVFDGGGIDPDIVTEWPQLPVLVYELLQQNMIFDFATHYRVDNNEIPPAKEFEFTDADFEKFKKFLDESAFSYTIESEAKLKELESIAKRENFLDEIKPQIEALAQSLSRSKEEAIDKSRTEINRMLEVEIASRYYLQKGEIETQLKWDIDVQEALSIISDNKSYLEILGK